MHIPDETWARMLILLWVVLVAEAIPLALLTPIRRRRGKEVRQMWIKYLAWFIMVPVITVPMILGDLWMQIVFLLLSLYAFEEFARAVGLWKEQTHMWLGRVCIVLVYLPVFNPWFGFFMSTPVYVIVLIFLLPIVRDKYQGMIQRSCLTMLGVIYFGWFLGHLAYLLHVPDGRALILAFLLMVVSTDASAYLIGSTFGRKRLSPNLSPNKTVEGALGSIAVAIGVTFGVRFALVDISVLHTVLLGFLLGIGAICGDLTISMIKRDVHIKDTGSIIPGHGGLLDRLDSILFAAPLFVHFMNYFYDIIPNSL